VAEASPMVENLKGRVRSFFRTEYCLVTAATATGLIKARSIRLHRDLDGQMYGSTIRPSDGRLVNPSPLLGFYPVDCYAPANYPVRAAAQTCPLLLGPLGRQSSDARDSLEPL
jgi:hypothetical protein